MLGLDSKYYDSLWNSYLQEREAVAPDWRNAFDFIKDVYGDLASEQPSAHQARRPDRLRAYLHRFGHLHADLDPLGLAPVPDLPEHLEAEAREAASLVALYRGTMAVETGHIDDPAMCDWIAENFESSQGTPVPPRARVLQWLIEAETFDRFLAKKHPTKKRFGSEGADAILPLLSLLREEAAKRGVDELVVGSMHRGRLSILHNFAGLDAGRLLSMFGGQHPYPRREDLPADVSYHLGHRDERDGVRTTVLPNPSHLEAVNPVVVGYVRARRTEGSGRAMATIVHTDASVIGQGVNAELLQMSALPGFSVGGTIHVVVNNQVGFTTDPDEARSSRYCTGSWRAVDSLLIHVNGDDMDAVTRAARLAVKFRAKYERDVVIDLVCYRRNGHNEIDEPRFTQPLYYQAVDRTRSCVESYTERAVEAGIVGTAAIEAHRHAMTARLEAAYVASPDAGPDGSGPTRRNLFSRADLGEDDLREIVTALACVPADQGSPKVVKLMERRLDELEEGITWPLAEAMAFGAVLRAGIPVRLCGQDVERGAFSQRHLAVVDPWSGRRTRPLGQLARDGATLEIVNSPLSEYAVLGFEYGYSLGSTGSLCVWEAQFGDFANGAQIIIDQFIASGFEKWMQTSNLTVLLPHGLEGQGPEHSSARIERLLQLCARDNIRVAHPTTPANYHHLLREQAIAAERPLFVLTPKVLLRHPLARSPLNDFLGRFQPVLASAPPGATRAVICSGKLAYELEKARGQAKVVVVRLECLHPFPFQGLVEVLGGLNLAEILWVQEEPENFGAASWLGPKLHAVARACGARLLPPVARGEAASPAGSFHGWHGRDQDRLLARALGRMDRDDRV